MKTVTAFVGSARKNGVTYRATRRFLDDLQAFGDVRGEIVLLSECDLRLCRGCKACFLRGEEYCPLHDDRDVLIDKMTRSDGVVLASPTYSFQVSAIMKAFLDRLGFAIHRPRFHGKTVTSIVVEGRYGGRRRGEVSRLHRRRSGLQRGEGQPHRLQEEPEHGARADDGGGAPEDGRGARQAEPPISRAAVEARLSRTVDAPAPGVQDGPHRHQAGAKGRRPGLRVLPRSHGWFDSDYYYPTKLGPLKRAAGAAFDRVAARSSKPRACRVT